MLLSPYFALRIELGDQASSTRLTAYEVAARLGHFATRRAPDASSALAPRRQSVDASELYNSCTACGHCPRVGERASCNTWNGSASPAERRPRADAECWPHGKPSALVGSEAFRPSKLQLARLLTAHAKTYQALALHYGSAQLASKTSWWTCRDAFAAAVDRRFLARYTVRRFGQADHGAGFVPNLDLLSPPPPRWPTAPPRASASHVASRRVPAARRVIRSSTDQAWPSKPSTTKVGSPGAIRPGPSRSKSAHL